MNEPVTTIIPTFQRPALVRRAIASALAQTYGEVRVHVYDNASNDTTGSIVAHIAAGDPRVSYYRHQRHIDFAENFLFGMERVDTPYFSFLSDDDVLFPDFYASAVEDLGRYPDALFAAGSVIEFDERGAVRYAPLALWRREGRYEPPEGFYAMLGNRHPTWTGIVFRREALALVGALDPAVGNPIDLDYELRAAARFPYVVSFKPCAAYVHHEQRVSVTENATVIAGYRRIQQKLMADAAIDPRLRERIPQSLEQQMRRKLHEIAFKSVIAGDVANARHAAKMLQQDFREPVTAWGIRSVASLSRAVPPVRFALSALEAARLRRRSHIARTRLRMTYGEDGSRLSRYLSLNGPASI